MPQKLPEGTISDYHFGRPTVGPSLRLDISICQDVLFSCDSAGLSDLLCMLEELLGIMLLQRDAPRADPRTTNSHDRVAPHGG